LSCRDPQPVGEMAADLTALGRERLATLFKVSADARYVAFKDQNKIIVWETSPRRPLLCWLIVSCLVLVALWLAWPRRSCSAMASIPLTSPPQTAPRPAPDTLSATRES